MENDNIYVRDQIVTSEQAVENALSYQPNRGDRSNLFVELSEVEQETFHPSNRRRVSSIVNTYDGSINIQRRESLDSFVRKHFRTSAEHNSVLEIKRGPSIDSILIEPVPRDFRRNSFDQRYSGRIPNLKEDTDLKEIKRSVNIMMSKNEKSPNRLKPSKASNYLDHHTRQESNLIVMPAFEPISIVNEENPFATERRKSQKEDRRKSQKEYGQKPKVKVVLSVEPMDADDEDKLNNTKKRRDSYKTGAAIPSTKAKDMSFKSKKRSSERKEEKQWRNAQEDFDKNRNPYGGSTTQQIFVVKPQPNQSRSKNIGKRKPDSQNDTSEDDSTANSYITTSEDERSTSVKSTTSSKITRKSTFGSYNPENPKETLGWEDTESKDKMASLIGQTPQKQFKDSYELTREASQRSTSTKKHPAWTNDTASLIKREDSTARKRKPTQFKPLISVKAPRSASKVITKRRYHIQVPEEGKTETWFNVFFNFKDNSNIDWSYEGPVKIKNYYSTSSYV